MKHTQRDIAEFVEYMDDIDELEVKRKNKIERRAIIMKKRTTIVIVMLSVIVLVVASVQLVKG